MFVLFGVILLAFTALAINNATWEARARASPETCQVFTSPQPAIAIGFKVVRYGEIYFLFPIALGLDTRYFGAISNQSALVFTCPAGSIQNATRAQG